MSQINPQDLLARMQLMAARAAGQTQSQLSATDNGFSQVFQKALSSVNQIQQNASTLSARYERGEAVDLPDVMIATQKANLAFTALVEVRNKLISAYQEISNMPM